MVCIEQGEIGSVLEDMAGDMEAIIFAPLRICMWWEMHGIVIGR